MCNFLVSLVGVLMYDMWWDSNSKILQNTMLENILFNEISCILQVRVFHTFIFVPCILMIITHE